MKLVQYVFIMLLCSSAVIINAGGLTENKKLQQEEWNMKRLMWDLTGACLGAFSMDITSGTLTGQSDVHTLAGGMIFGLLAAEMYAFCKQAQKRAEA